jgi:hypothetical protein
MNFVGPLLCSNGIAVERVDNWVVAGFLLGIARRQKYEDVAIHGVSLQIAFKGCAVNLDVLHRDGICPGNHWRYLGLDLCGNVRAQSNGDRQRR